MNPEKRPIRVARRSGDDIQEEIITKPTAYEEFEMMTAGLEEFANSGEDPQTAVGKHIAALDGNFGFPDDGYVDDQGMPQRRNASVPTSVHEFLKTTAVNDENHRGFESTTISDGFGGGDKGNEEIIDDPTAGFNAVGGGGRKSHRMVKAEPTQTFVTEVVDQTDPRERDTSHSFPSRDDNGLYDRDINQNGEDPNIIPPKHFNEEGSWAIPGVSQDQTSMPVKDIDIMASYRMTLSDGRKIIGRIASQTETNLNFVGHIEGERSNCSFPVLKIQIANLEPIRIRQRTVYANNLESAYFAFKTAGEKTMTTRHGKVHRVVQQQGDFVKIEPGTYGNDDMIVDAKQLRKTSAKRRADSANAPDGAQARMDNTRGPGMLFGDDAALYDQLDKRTKGLETKKVSIQGLLAAAERLEGAGRQDDLYQVEQKIEAEFKDFKDLEAGVVNIKTLIAKRCVMRKASVSQQTHIRPFVEHVAADPDNKNPFLDNIL